MTSQYAELAGAEPYFSLVRGALGDLVDGVHFFDLITDTTIYEVLYNLGWPRVIEGRTELIKAFQGYVKGVRLDSADKLVSYRADGDRVVIIEYEVNGTMLASNTKYNNRFCSIIKLENRKIAHWRDYMDSHAAWSAMTGQK